MSGRIMFVSSITRYGGGERWMLDAAAGLARRGHAVRLISRPGSALDERARGLGLDTATSDMRFDFDPAAIIRLSSFFNEFQPEIVCVNLDREIRICACALALTRLARRTGAIRWAKQTLPAQPPRTGQTTISDPPAPHKKRRGKIRLIPRRGSEFPLKSKSHYRFFYTRFVDAVIVNSHATRDTMISSAPWFPSGKAVMIYNGIDVSAYDALFRDRDSIRESFRRSLGLPRGARLITLVGELTERKGHRFIVDAAGELLGRYPDVHFVFAGDGDARSELDELVARRDLRGSFHFLGFRDDVPAILTASDVLVLPSRIEGFGYVLVEAMAASLPVVATRASSIPEVVEDGVTGFLHEYGRSGEIASLLARLLDDDALARAMGAAGRERARERFDIEIMLDLLETLFFTGSGA